MGREDSWDEDDWRGHQRGRRLDHDDFGNFSLRVRRSPRSGAVTLVVILNFVAGPLMLFFLLCAGYLSLRDDDTFLGIPGQKPSAMVKMALGMMAFGWAVGCLAVGVGLSYRAGWSRMLALILGGFAALAGIVSVALTIMILAGPRGSAPGGNEFYWFRSLAQTIFFLGYCLWSYVVLLNPRHLADFP